MNNFRIPGRKLFRTYFTNDFRYTDDFQANYQSELATSIKDNN